MSRLALGSGAVLLALALSTPARTALAAAPYARTVSCAPLRATRASASDGAVVQGSRAEGAAACGPRQCLGTTDAQACHWISDRLARGWLAQVEPQKPPASKFRHDPSFPAAFVFESNSALYLAVDSLPGLEVSRAPEPGVGG